MYHSWEPLINRGGPCTYCIRARRPFVCLQEKVTIISNTLRLGPQTVPQVRHCSEAHSVVPRESGRAMQHDSVMMTITRANTQTILLCEGSALAFNIAVAK
jgi:hypothetical protein